MTHPMTVLSPRAALAVSALLPESLAASLAAFLDEYLGAEQEVPFGGRDAELAALDQWLSDPASGTALVVSEAGQGKSALVTRWAASVAASGVRVVFAPISLRFGTALRGAALRLLVHQLAFATGRKLPEVRDAAALLAECEAALAASASDAAADRIVVVLDGLDEAIDWTPGVDLDLSSASPQIKLLLAARSTPGRDAAGWCQALRLAPSTRTLNLGALGPASVEQLLRGAGLSEVYSPALAAEVQRLSEGDPLLVRLYLEALRATSGAGAAFTASDLPRTPPGLEGWFSRWWEQLSQRLVGYPALAPLAEEVFDLLATALGPLPVTVLLALVNADRAVAVSTHELAALLRELRPLLIGDGARVPLVLSHPRLRYFRLEKLSQAQRSELNRRFCALGEAQLRALVAGGLPASEPPPYLVQYLGAHLELAASSPDVERNLAAERSLAALVCQPWQQAWEALEGTFDGFLEDVGRAWRAARRSDTRGTAEAMVLAARCSLVSSSIASLAYHLPPNLAGHLIDHGVWTPAVAVSQLRWPAGGYRSEALVSLAPWLDAPLVRRVLAESAQGGHFHDLQDVEGVGALLGRLIELDCAEEVPARIEPFAPAVRAMIVAVAWKLLPKALWPTLARWVIEGAPQVSHCSYAASTAFVSLPILEESERAPVIRRALDRLWDEDFGLDNEHAAMLGAAGRWQHGWDAAMRETSHYPRMAMSAHIAPFVPAELSDQAYQQWWTAYQEAAKGHSLLSLSVPRGLRPQMISELMAFLQSRSNDLSIAKPLVLIAYQDRTRLPEALAAVRRLAGPDGALARLSLAPVCDEATASTLAAEAYQLIEALMREHGEAELRQRDQYWPRSPEYLPWTYIGSWRDPTVLWVETLRWLPRSQRRPLVRALFARFRCVEDQDTVLASAAAVAAHLEAPAREPWTARLLSMVRAEEDHPITLTNLALIASGERRGELAEAAWRGRIPDGQERRCGEALAKAARLVPAERLPALQVQALQRWQEQHYSEWSSFMREVRASLTPEAIAVATRAFRGESSRIAIGEDRGAIWVAGCQPRGTSDARSQ
jgi:AAA ATPase domain